ncbi:MAG: DUF6531 domain-containing protein, partial [Solirubrobacterales bacterium]
MAVLLAVVGAHTASAAALCKNGVSTSLCSESYGPGQGIEVSLSESTRIETTSASVLDTCAGSTLKAKTTNKGSATEAVKANVEELTWKECSNTTDTLKLGSLQIDWISGTDNGTLTSSGTEWTTNTIFGTCTYGTGTDLGTVTGGSPAKISINAVISKTAGGFACPSDAVWKAGYTVTNPKPLYVASTAGPGFAINEGLGGKNPANPKVTICVKAAPVNCASGNQSEEQTDLSLGGRGPALKITRSYNSQAAVAAKEAGPWGYGWSGPYGAHLEVNKEAATATVFQENGAAAVFYLSGSTYSPAAWGQATLVKETVESKEIYVFTLPTQEKLKFNSEGKLTEVKDRNGNALTLTYTEGKLTAVKDGAGRELK